jgi:hypothetical protein
MTIFLVYFCKILFYRHICSNYLMVYDYPDALSILIYNNPMVYDLHIFGWCIICELSRDNHKTDLRRRYIIVEQTIGNRFGPRRGSNNCRHYGFIFSL